MTLLMGLVPDGAGSWSLNERGMATQIDLGARPAGLAPIDPTILAKVPAGALSVVAVGLDGAQLWQTHGEGIVDAIAATDWRADPVRKRQELDAMVQLVGGGADLAEAISGINGTVVAFAHGDGGLLPGLTVALPSSPLLDGIARFLAAEGGVTLPEVGDFKYLVISKGPMGRAIGLGGLVLGRTATNWWVSTDPLFLEDCMAGATGGWIDGPIGKRALAAAGTDKPDLIGGSDTPKVMRSLMPLAALAGNGIGQEPAIRAINRILHTFARICHDDIVVGRATEAGWRLNLDGSLAGVTNTGSWQLPIIAAIAIPNLLESRITANESAAATTLKAAIFAAQVQYSAGSYSDADGDNRGEYAFLNQLAGGADCFGQGQGADHRPGLQAGGVNSLSLLGPEFKDAAATQAIAGYHFKVFLPISDTEMVDYATYKKLLSDGKLDPAGINHAEKYFIAYAWPEVFGDTGRRVFALTQEGRVLTTLPGSVDLPPAWNAVVNGRADATVQAATRAPDWAPHAR